jgi:hypothetical protein
MLLPCFFHASSILLPSVSSALDLYPSPVTSTLARSNPHASYARSIAWSRAGTIASITPDGKLLEFRYLRCSPDDGSWALSEPTVSDIVSGTDDNPLVHLVWAGTSSQELAVLDAVGRISILSFNTCLNRPLQIRKPDLDPVDDLHSVVGCYWLNLMPQGRQVCSSQLNYPNSS